MQKSNKMEVFPFRKIAMVFGNRRNFAAEF